MRELNQLTVDERIDRLLEQRYPGALDALGKSFFSKIGSKLKSAVKKVAPIALGAGAAFIGGGLLSKAGAGVAGKVASSGKSRAPKAAKRGKIRGALKSAGKAVASVALPVAQAAAQDAISAGLLPPTPRAAGSQEELIAAAVQIARSELMKQGLEMSSPAAQAVLRQAVQEAGAGAAAAEPGFDWKKAAPWIAGGAGVVLLSTVLMQRRPAR